MTITIAEVVQRIDDWDGKHIEIRELSGGITNTNFRVQVDDESFFVRLPGSKTELLGIDRESEYAANMAAGKVGIAPEVVYFIRPEGCLVTRFIEGRRLPPEEIGQSQNIRKIAEILQKIHNLRPIPGTFSPFRMVEDYAEIAHHHNVAFPRSFDLLMERMREVEVAFLTSPFEPRLCHNDLLNNNFLYDGQIRVLDWEYAGMGDVFFDLANFSVHHGFSDQQDRWLLESYFGMVTTTRWARLKLMKIISDFREAMWAMVQIAISQLEYDFPKYADRHFDRMTRSMQDVRWGQWLKDVVR